MGKFIGFSGSLLPPKESKSHISKKFREFVSEKCVNSSELITFSLNLVVLQNIFNFITVQCVMQACLRDLPPSSLMEARTHAHARLEVFRMQRTCPNHTS